MGRRYIYFCDTCGSDFKNDIHLNIKAGQLAISYPCKIDEADPTKSEWKQRNVLLPCQEYHFCNDLCVASFVKNKVNDLIKKLYEKDVSRRVDES